MKEITSRFFRRIGSARRVGSPLLFLSRNASSTALIHDHLYERTPYVAGWKLQQQLLRERMNRIRAGIHFSDRILMFEHDATYTLGRGAKEEYLSFELSENDRSILCRKNGKRLSLQSAEQGFDDCFISAPNGVPIFRVERGGEVTFHGPGQIVCYPLFDLTKDPFKKDLHWYLRAIEEVVIKVLARYNIEGARDDINSGVFVGTNKICAIGLSSSRWMTTHGFALNINCDLKYFDTSIIMPCGLEGRGVTSVQRLLGKRIEMNQVADTILDCMEEVFRIDTEYNNI